MIITNKLFHTSFAVLILTLTGCATTEDDKRRFTNLNCYELAKEIGKQEAKIERAKEDELISDLDTIFADDKKREREANFDGIFASLDQNTAQDLLNILKEIEYKKDCRNK